MAIVMGTFKLDSDRRIFVFRDSRGNSVSMNKDGHWEVWRAGGKKDNTDHIHPIDALFQLMQGEE